MRFVSRLILTATTLGLMAVLRGACAAPQRQDLCLGNNTPGPFALSWNHVLPGTETVKVNGLTQMRGLDYTLDAEGGSVTFSRPLPARAAAEVTYDCDPSVSQRTGLGRTIPLTVDLLRGEHGYFSFNALGKQDRTESSALTLGLGMGWQGAGERRFSTRFFYTPVVAASGDAPGDSFAKRMGLSVDAATNAGNWGLFSVGFARAGAGLDTAGDNSLEAGQQKLSLSSRLSPAKNAQAQINWSRSAAAGTPGAPAATNSSVALSLAPSSKTQLSATMGQNGTDKSGMTQTVGASLEARPNAKMSVSAAYRGSDAPGTAGDTQAISLKTVLTPGKTLSVETTAGRAQRGDAVTDQQGILLSVNPRRTVQLGAGFALRQQTVGASPDSLNTAVALVNGTVQPLSFLEVSGSYKSRMAPARDTSAGDLFDTSTARIAFAPIKSVRFTGTYAQNPDDGGATAFDGSALQRLSRKGLGLETNFGALGLSGGYDWSRRYDAADTEEAIHADLGLRFSAATRLTVGFQTRQNALDPAATQSFAYTVGFTHVLGDRFNLSLSGKRSQTAASPSDYNATANLGMKF